MKPDAADPALAPAIDNGYSPARVMPDGSVAGIHKMLFTVGLFTHINWFSYGGRYCYELRSDAEAALAAWDGKGDPPGPWIKHYPSQRLGPGASC